MKISCVISEFNPFHNGHKYLIDKQRESGATHIVAVMSGSFVQRGECALLNKFCRAQSAIANGADLVLEVPAVWACSAAPVFARGGISIVKSMGVADSVFFGSECGDIDLMYKCAQSLLSPEFAEAFSKYKTDGSYANAVQKAVCETAGEECASLLSSPNNILAVEYVKEIIAQKVDVTAETFSRTGTAHDSNTPSGNYASASFIRENINNPDLLSSLIPDNTLELIENSVKCGDIANMSELKNIIMYRLRTAHTDEIACLPDVSEGLENRIKQAAMTCATLDDVLNSVVCKRYSAPRIRRVFALLLLDIDKKMQSKTPPYIRILGFNSRGGEILKLMKKSCSVPIITKAAHYKSLLDKFSAEIFEKDILATDIRCLACKNKTPMGQDFLISPYICND